MVGRASSVTILGVTLPSAATPERRPDVAVPGPGGADPPPAPQAPVPAYKGEPLDAARGPGLGCFWVQVAVLTILLVATPLSVVMGAPPWLSGAMLIVTLVLLLFAGQTVIFLLRLVAADRRSRRRPLSTTARRTVGMLEDEGREKAAETRTRVTRGERET